MAQPTTGALTIRAAARQDLPAILAIFASDTLGGHAESHGLADMAVYETAFAEIAASPDNTLFVAESAGRVVGTFQLTLIPGLVGHGVRRAKLESVHVLASERGNGIGAAMVAFAIEEARRRGAATVELTSNKKRLDAHRFYERLSFTRSHEGFKLSLDA